MAHFGGIQWASKVVIACQGIVDSLSGTSISLAECVEVFRTGDRLGHSKKATDYLEVA